MDRDFRNTAKRKIFTFCVDVSESMQKRCENGVSIIENVNNFLKDVIEKYKKGDLSDSVVIEVINAGKDITVCSEMNSIQDVKLEKIKVKKGDYETSGVAIKLAKHNISNQIKLYNEKRINYYRPTICVLAHNKNINELIKDEDCDDIDIVNVNFNDENRLSIGDISKANISVSLSSFNSLFDEDISFDVNFNSERTTSKINKTNSYSDFFGDDESLSGESISISLNEE